ncbi:MAG: hypothetical protein HQM10_20210 [Candidatus Riflebacteria bacterium]|nr:hypothetical protein [Candidatus Riflebacteria bacterium]
MINQKDLYSQKFMFFFILVLYLMTQHVGLSNPDQSTSIAAFLKIGIKGYEFFLLDTDDVQKRNCIWKKKEWLEENIPELLNSKMTLDVESYLKKRIPSSLFRILQNNSIRLIVAGGLLKDTIRQMPFWGLRPIFGFIQKRDINSKAYLFGRNKKGEWTLVITNIFGRDRITHVFLEYAFLFQYLERSFDGLEWQEPENYNEITGELCAGALSSIDVRPDDIVVFGYQSSFNVFAWYLQKFSEAYFLNKKIKWSLEEFRQFKKSLPRPNLFPRPVVRGNDAFPYWEYEICLPCKHKVRKTSDVICSSKKNIRFLSWRNVYGDAAGSLIAELLKKGIRRFIVFGNAGTLNFQYPIGKIIAPTSVNSNNASYVIPNQATKFYSPGKVVGVRSILEESRAWLNNAQHSNDLVEVEHASIANSLIGWENIFFFSGLVVSDHPGRLDITKFQESTPEILEAKDTFFFEAIKSAIDY